LFCSECGVYLLTGGPLRTEPLPESDLPASRADPWATSTPGAAETAVVTLTITVVASGRQLPLTGSNEFVLGRLDATRGVFPDVDLTPDGGLEGGVSRRHARIQRQRTQFFIEDLGSANGTFLNGQRLTPYLPHPLHDGDELQIGRIRLQIGIH
jgi:pSer/pThr/pTyr-binding forkhead associated (FHA) protein